MADWAMLKELVLVFTERGCKGFGVFAPVEILESIATKLPSDCLSKLGILLSNGIAPSA